VFCSRNPEVEEPDTAFPARPFVTGGFDTSKNPSDSSPVGHFAMSWFDKSKNLMVQEKDNVLLLFHPCRMKHSPVSPHSVRFDIIKHKI
jgi:hypothetical protein